MSSLLMLVLAAEARAQPSTPLGGKLLISVNGGGQLGGSDIDSESTFSLYGEDASIRTHQELGGGAVFDIGANYRIGQNWGFGVAFNKTGDRADAVIDGSLPNPLYFDRLRSFTTTSAGLKHDETAVHLQAVLYVPFTDKVDFVFTAGPTIFNVKQEFAGNVAFTNTGSEFEGVAITGVEVVSLKESAVGFNIGADMSYAIFKNLGAGVLLRYTHGSIGFDRGASGSPDISAGGFQIGVGARVRF